MLQEPKFGMLMVPLELPLTKVEDDLKREALELFNMVFWPKRKRKMLYYQKPTCLSFWLCPGFFRFCGLWGTLTWTGLRKTCLGIMSSKGGWRLRVYETRSWLRSSIKCGETRTSKTRRGAGCCCWRVLPASPLRPRWRNICWSEKPNPIKFYFQI